MFRPLFTAWLQGRLSLLLDADGKSFLTKFDASLESVVEEATFAAIREKGAE